MLCTFASTNTAIMDWNTNIEIIGTKGSIAFTIDFPENITQLFVSEGTKKKYREELVAIEKNFHSNILTAANYYGLSHNKQFGNFKAAIVDGETIKVGVPQALDTLSVINQIYNNAND